MLESLIPENIPVGTIIADGAYYSIEGVETLKGIILVIPPLSNGTIHGKDNTKWHDEVVEYIKAKGSVYAFYKKYCYGVGARIEAQISRINRCIGSSLLTKKIASQKSEAIVIANIYVLVDI